MYEIIKLSWSKRRPLDPEREIQNIRIENYKEEQNHICKMFVKYEKEETEKELIGRVVFNSKLEYWTILGVNGSGDCCAVKKINK